MDPIYAGFVESLLTLSDAYEKGLIEDVAAIEQWCQAMVKGARCGKNYIEEPFDELPVVLGMGLNGLFAAEASTMPAEKRLSFLIVDADSQLVHQALDSLDLPAHITVHYFTPEELAADEEARRFVDSSDVIVVDVMGKKLADFLIEKVDFKTKKVYALRGSRDNDTLKKLGFIFDGELRHYYNNLSEKNIRNMLRLVVHRHFDPSVSYGPVEKIPKLGLFHPDALDSSCGTQPRAMSTVKKKVRENYVPRVKFLLT